MTHLKQKANFIRTFIIPLLTGKEQYSETINTFIISLLIMKEQFLACGIAA